VFLQHCKALESFRSESMQRSVLDVRFAGSECDKTITPACVSYGKTSSIAVALIAAIASTGNLAFAQTVHPANLARSSPDGGSRHKASPVLCWELSLLKWKQNDAMIRKRSVTKAQPSVVEREKLRTAMGEGRVFGLLLRTTTHAFLMAVQASIAEYDVSLHQYFVLRELWDEPGLNQRVLCARLDTHEPTMVATIGNMVDLGYVERSRNQRDRRKLFRRIETVNKRAVAGMSDNEAVQLRELLSRAKGNLVTGAPADGSRAKVNRVIRMRL
jgi:DNA-binding MarR family transcriptional regulator